MPTFSASALRARLPSFVAGAALAVASLAAHADIEFTGDQVRVDYFLDTVAAAQTSGPVVQVSFSTEYNPFVVQASELTPSFNLGSIDVYMNEINITLDAGTYQPCPINACGYDGIRITNLSTGRSFRDYVATLTPGATGVVFQQDSHGDLWFDFRAVDPYTTSNIQVTLLPVPEPGSLALMLGGAAVLLRRRKD